MSTDISVDITHSKQDPSVLVVYTNVNYTRACLIITSCIFCNVLLCSHTVLLYCLIAGSIWFINSYWSFWFLIRSRDSNWDIVITIASGYYKIVGSIEEVGTLTGTLLLL